MNKQIKHVAYYTKNVVQEGVKARPTYRGSRIPYCQNCLLLY
ncbi:hypothetical protein [Bacillus sp. JJ1562]